MVARYSMYTVVCKCYWRSHLMATCNWRPPHLADKSVGIWLVGCKQHWTLTKISVAWWRQHWPLLTKKGPFVRSGVSIHWAAPWWQRKLLFPCWAPPGQGWIQSKVLFSSPSLGDEWGLVLFASHESLAVNTMGDTNWSFSSPSKMSLWPPLPTKRDKAAQDLVWKQGCARTSWYPLYLYNVQNMYVYMYAYTLDKVYPSSNHFIV